MREAMLEEWNKIGEDEILEFVDSIPKCIEAVIAAHGTYTYW